MGRHRRPGSDEEPDERDAPRSASDLLRGTGYDLPDSRRRRRDRDTDARPEFTEPPTASYPPPHRGPQAPPGQPWPSAPPGQPGQPRQQGQTGHRDRPTYQTGPVPPVVPARHLPSGRPPAEPPPGYPPRQAPPPPDQARRPPPDRHQPPPDRHQPAADRTQPPTYRTGPQPRLEPPPGYPRSPARSGSDSGTGYRLDRTGPAGPPPAPPRAPGRGPRTDPRQWQDPEHSLGRPDGPRRRPEQPGDPYRAPHGDPYGDPRRDADPRWSDGGRPEHTGPGRDVVLSPRHRPGPARRRGPAEDDAAPGRGDPYPDRSRDRDRDAEFAGPAIADAERPDRRTGPGGVGRDLVPVRAALEPVNRRGEPDDVDPDQPDDDVVDDRSLVQAWMSFVGQILVAAAAGLGVWLGFQALWRRWPYGAAPAAAGVLVVMLLVGHQVHKRRHPDEPPDMVTAGVLVIVGLVLTISPAAFVLRPL